MWLSQQFTITYRLQLSAHEIRRFPSYRMDRSYERGLGKIEKCDYYRWIA